MLTAIAGVTAARLNSACIAPGLRPARARNLVVSLKCAEAFARVVPQSNRRMVKLVAGSTNDDMPPAFGAAADATARIVAKAAKVKLFMIARECPSSAMEWYWVR